jgi:prepilin-type N-terminal cleavage/methylation domain-containing protein
VINKIKVKKGFSLLEITIVLAIITTILAMIPFTKGIVTSSKANRLISEIGEYKVRIGNFYSVFGEIPGDFCQSSRAFDAAEKNGNCDKVLSVLPIDANNTAIRNEALLFWRHMYLHEKSGTVFTGVGNTLTMPSKIGSNLPASALDKRMGYYPVLRNGISGSVETLGLNLARCTKQQSSDGLCIKAGVENKVLQQVDIKSDDGMPATGMVLGLNDSDLKCNTSTLNVINWTVDSTVKYVNTANEGCIAWFAV